MKVSFDGIRKNLAAAYKKTVLAYREAVEENGFDGSFEEVKDGLDDLRQMVGALLCCYDPEAIERDNDFHDLADLIDKLPFADPKDDEKGDFGDEYDDGLEEDEI